MYLIIHILLVLSSSNFSALVNAAECRPEEYKTNDGQQCCPMCNKGSVVRRDCTLESSTSCIPCGRDTYMNSPNGLTKCFLCTSCSADPGLVTTQECTSTSNAVCGVRDGYYCKSYNDDSMCNLVEKHTKCTPGQRTKAPGTHNTDTECEACQQGSFSLDGLTCIAHTECLEGQIQREGGNTTKDVVCSAAEASSRNHNAIIPPLLFVTLLISFLVFKVLMSCWQEKTTLMPSTKLPVQEEGESSPGANSGTGM